MKFKVVKEGLIVTIIAFVLFSLYLGLSSSIDISGQQQAIDAVVQLKSDRGSCTGVQVNYKNKNYILSAAHCLPIGGLVHDAFLDIDYPAMPVIYRDTSYHLLRILAFDELTDLALIQSYRTDGIYIADTSENDQRVYTITHGAGHPLYRTDGVIIRTDYTPEGAPATWVKTLSTAWIVPGSSGGPLLNLNHELVGIVTNYDANRFFNYSASLQQIKKFMEDYLGSSR